MGGFRLARLVIVSSALAALALGCGQEEAPVVELGGIEITETMTPEAEAAALIEMLKAPSTPPEMKVLTVEILAAYDPAITIEPLVALLRVEEPIVLLAVMRSLPPAAEAQATPELILLSEQHPEEEVRDAARERLDEFRAFHE